HHIPAVNCVHPGAEQVPLAIIGEPHVHSDSGKRFPLGGSPGERIYASRRRDCYPADRGRTARWGSPCHYERPDPLPRHDAVASEGLGGMPIEIGAATEAATISRK